MLGSHYQPCVCCSAKIHVTNPSQCETTRMPQDNETLLNTFSKIVIPSIITYEYLVIKNGVPNTEPRDVGVTLKLSRTVYETFLLRKLHTSIAFSIYTP